MSDARRTLRDIMTQAFSEARRRLEQDRHFDPRTGVRSPDFGRAMLDRLEDTYRAESARMDWPHLLDRASERNVWVDAETGRAIQRNQAGGLFWRGIVYQCDVQEHSGFSIGARFDEDGDGIEWAHALAYLAGCDEHDDCRTCVPLARDCWRSRNRQPPLVDLGDDLPRR